MTKLFDTNVQQIKNAVLREVARSAWSGENNLLDIPQKVVSGDEATMRCCVYKERAVVLERIKLALGGDKANPNIIEVIDIACDECPMHGYEVTKACRGCLAHRCSEVCKRGAIVFDKSRAAVIDKSKCVECGACAEVCPFGAIVNFQRPCERACKIDAISVHSNGKAQIDGEKCVQCGACVYQCPWGAVMDKSYITDVIELIKQSENNTKYNVYAVAAPSISSQFSYARLGQVVSAIKSLGFHSVAEAALGADMTARLEAKELEEKQLLTSSCCPAFVDYIGKSFPELTGFVSQNLSPAAEISRYIKSEDPTAKIVFIGPCTAKKAEYKDKSRFVDSVLTFEELQALFDSRGIDPAALADVEFGGATPYGRGFAFSGGVSEAVRGALSESNFELTPVICSGLEDCTKALRKLKAGKLGANFIEGMACVGGCVGGAGCLTHS